MADSGATPPHRSILATLLLLATLLAAGAPALGQTTGPPDAASAQEYTYLVNVEDPPGDHKGPGAAGLALPNTINPESDILRIEATDDRTTFIARITVATLQFGNNQGRAGASINLIGPGGEAWELGISYDNGGLNPQATDFDPLGGDPDTPMPATRVEVDAENNALYLFVDLQGAQLAFGDELVFAGAHSSRTIQGQTFTHLDEVPLTGVYVLGAATKARPLPPIHLQQQGNKVFLDHIYTEATTQQHTVNWTTPAKDVEIRYNATILEGEAGLRIIDGDNNTVLEATLLGNFSDTIRVEDLTPGTWSIQLDYRGFRGNLTLLVERYIPLPFGGGLILDDEPQPKSKDTPGAGILVLPALTIAALVAAPRTQRRNHHP